MHFKIHGSSKEYLDKFNKFIHFLLIEIEANNPRKKIVSQEAKVEEVKAKINTEKENK